MLEPLYRPNRTPLGHHVCFPASSCFSLLDFLSPLWFHLPHNSLLMPFSLCVFVLLCFSLTLASGFSVNICSTSIGRGLDWSIRQREPHIQAPPLQGSWSALSFLPLGQVLHPRSVTWGQGLTLIMPYKGWKCCLRPHRRGLRVGLELADFFLKGQWKSSSLHKIYLSKTVRFSKRFLMYLWGIT